MKIIDLSRQYTDPDYIFHHQEEALESYIGHELNQALDRIVEEREFHGRDTGTRSSS